MSRLHIVLLISVFSFLSFGQKEYQKNVEFADQKVAEGDYVYALNYYQKAMKIDSTSVDIYWKYAQALRAFKDYRKAEYYYAKVYEREETQIYEESLLYLGLMQKQNGKYAEALETFKLAKKKYRSSKNKDIYAKARQEFKSCLWAKNAIRDTSTLVFEALPVGVNTKNAEFGHRVHNQQLYFSSLRADSISANEEVYADSYSTQIYRRNLIGDGDVERIKDLALDAFNTGNGSFSLDGKRFYFSACKPYGGNYQCKILVAYTQNGRFSDIDTLGEIINEAYANTTMPYIGEWEGEEVLFFVSDREKGKGGLDIWYSFIEDGNQYKKPRNARSINTAENDLSPYWDGVNQRLYFSNSWDEGFGGYDVFYSEYNNGWGEAVNLGAPINSPANDLYYFQAGDSAFVSSNRLGVLYSKNPTCCSDVFVAYRLPQEEEELTPQESLEELNKRLPITLYFHNDIPDPRSIDTTSQVNYIDSYNDYMAMLDRYKKEYSAGLSGEAAQDAKDDIEDFFVEYVEQGVKDLEIFRDLLLEELNKGRKIKLTVKGFASPLAKSDYNVNLTKRRIASLKNYLEEYGNGEFKKHFEAGNLTIEEVPFGEYTANTLTSDNPNDKKNSIYSRAAAIERKIEVQSVFLDTLKKEAQLEVKEPIYQFDTITEGEIIHQTFVLENTGNAPLYIDSLQLPCHCISATLNDSIILPGERLEIPVVLDTKNYKGRLVQSVYVYTKGADKPMRLILVGIVEEE
ncbi:Protein of unknown function [Lishizhenia tianjinensis]|uniref:Uncharacterized protein n=1 Tax=Lishizhenia tianjinensis TaxID=477690 RepID=A0A1I6ZVB9_9FLAO|nr:DUF1573 domain-containing protein [Lishizhenia tianjinensis]SFT66638.1 Protein of unknown function [Lishizhenia tianjinensis]